MGRNEKDLSRSREECVLERQKIREPLETLARRLGGLKRPPRREEESRRGLSPGLFPPDRVAIMNGFCLTL